LSAAPWSLSGTVVDPKKIYKIALDHHRSSLILGYNHPSENIQPGEADHKVKKGYRLPTYHLKISNKGSPFTTKTQIKSGVFPILNPAVSILAFLWHQCL